MNSCISGLIHQQGFCNVGCNSIVIIRGKCLMGGRAEGISYELIHWDGRAADDQARNQDETSCEGQHFE